MSLVSLTGPGVMSGSQFTSWSWWVFWLDIPLAQVECWPNTWRWLQPFAANKPSSLATTSCGQSICNTYVILYQDASIWVPGLNPRQETEVRVSSAPAAPGQPLAMTACNQHPSPPGHLFCLWLHSVHDGLGGLWAGKNAPRNILN